MENVAEVGWAAGLFEGEGCIFFFRQAHHVMTHVRLSIQMTDQDVLDKFCRIVECGKVGPPQKHPNQKPHHKPLYVWQISNRADCERILLMFRPWFGTRRGAKADETLALIAEMDRECRGCGKTFRARRLDMFFHDADCRSRWNYLQHRAAEPSKMGRPRVL